MDYYTYHILLIYYPVYRFVFKHFLVIFMNIISMYSIIFLRKWFYFPVYLLYCVRQVQIICLQIRFFTFKNDSNWFFELLIIKKKCISVSRFTYIYIQLYCTRTQTSLLFAIGRWVIVNFYGYMCYFLFTFEKLIHLLSTFKFFVT